MPFAPPARCKERVAVSSDNALLNQRSLWGVNPRVVESLIANHERDVASLRARIAELESRPDPHTAPHDAASPPVSGDHAEVHNRIMSLEARLSDALAQMGAIEDAALRYQSAAHLNALREEATHAVADAWATAQTIEERTRQLVERTRETLRADADAVRAQMEDEHTRHRAEIERLAAEHAQMVRQLETTARELRNQPMRSADDAIPAASLTYPDRDPESSATDTTIVEADAVASATRPTAQVVHDRRVPVPPTTGYRAFADATTLNNALDELEALLNLPRERWQDLPNTAATGTNEVAARTASGDAST